MKLANRAAATTLSLVVLAAISSPVVMAQDTGWYIGGNVGRSISKLDDSRFLGARLPPGFITNSIHDDDHKTATKWFVGYQLNKYLSLEGGYFDLRRFVYVGNTVPAGSITGDIKLTGYNLDLVGMIPLSDSFSAFARVGANNAEAKDHFVGTGFASGVNSDPRKRQTNVKYGVGLQYAFNDAVAMRVEGERYRVDDAVGNKGNVDFISAGLIYRFGRTKPMPATYVSRAPDPVPEVIAPAPVTPVAPLPPATPAVQPRFERYTLSATELFAFNSAELQMPQPKLDDIATALNRNREVSNVAITGYADRIGSNQYNLRLSERRAISVKDYLVNKGVDSSRMKTEGKGEANPVVVCTNKKRSDLIKCLEPNRRVEVEQILIERRVQ